jgi:hypothetical protein
VAAKKDASPIDACVARFGIEDSIHDAAGVRTLKRRSSGSHSSFKAKTLDGESTAYVSTIDSARATSACGDR